MLAFILRTGVSGNGYRSAREESRLVAVTTTPEAEKFYTDAIQCLVASGVPFMIGGAYAMREYADIFRDTKDLDVFCKPSDYPALLEALSGRGYRTEVVDASWLAKAFQGEYYVDLIFNSGNGVAPVDDTWFQHAREVELLGQSVKLIPAEEELWQKCLVLSRERTDIADVCHIIRKMGPELDWERLLGRMEPYWEVLLAHLVLFRFIYPSERDRVPAQVMEELLKREQALLGTPTPQDRISRGPLLSRSDYSIDINDWGYKPH